MCVYCVRVLTSTHDLGGRVGPITTLLSRESEDQAADAKGREPLMSEVFHAVSSNVIIVG